MDDPILALLIPWVVFLPFFICLFVFNWRRRDCPDCGRPLPHFQSPFTKTRRQWVEGGFQCRDCGCETDLAGRKVAPGTVPRPGWLVRSVLLLLPPVVVAAVLLFLIFRVSRQEPAPPPLVAPAAAVPGR